jgi:predicted nuclease with TOPRIM domain
MLTQSDINEIKQVVKEEIDEKTRLLPTKEEFFSKMDEVMGELKASRESIDLHTGLHEDIDDQIDNHDMRLKKLEKIPAVA